MQRTRLKNEQIVNTENGTR